MPSEILILSGVAVFWIILWFIAVHLADRRDRDD